MRQAIWGLAALGCGAASAEAQTMFDGKIIECVTERSYDLLGGPQTTRYRFYGDGSVGVDVAPGALACDDGGRLPDFELGEPTDYAVHCARDGRYLESENTSIDYRGEGVATISVVGAEIRVADFVAYDVTIDGDWVAYTYESTMTLDCDGDVCVGGFSGQDDRGRRSGSRLNCVIYPLAGA